MKIAVLAGGLSPERDVSLSSGAKIATALSKRGHTVAYTDVYRAIDEKDVGKMFVSGGEYSYTIPSSPPDLEKIKRAFGEGDRLVGRGVVHLCEAADVTFLALHGGAGEDGRVSALLETLGIKHTGSDYASCHIAMDKALSKAVFRNAGVPTPDGILYDGGSLNDIALPAVVKPTGCGSSVGVSIVEKADELEKAIEFAAKQNCGILIERKIVGREFSVGILNGKALPAIEIIPNRGFYDYSNKYQAGATREICPADLTETQASTLAETALRAHNAIGLGAYSRLDFILEEQSGTFYCLEANALPGMTPSSLLPQEAAAVGISYDELCEIIAYAAI